MMQRIMLATTLMAFAMPAFADNDDPTADQIARIDKALMAMTCEVDPANIDVEAGGGFDLDDVICADGQYDVILNADYTEKERRKE